jgi:hypothetical protein
MASLKLSRIRSFLFIISGFLNCDKVTFYGSICWFLGELSEYRVLIRRRPLILGLEGDAISLIGLLLSVGLLRYGLGGGDYSFNLYITP